MGRRPSNSQDVFLFHVTVKNLKSILSVFPQARNAFLGTKYRWTREKNIPEQLKTTQNQRCEDIKSPRPKQIWNSCMTSLYKLYSKIIHPRKFQNMFLITLEESKNSQFCEFTSSIPKFMQDLPFCKHTRNTLWSGWTGQIIFVLGLIEPARPVMYQKLQNPTRSLKIPGASL